MSDSTPGDRLPVWARRDNPILVRELEVLPGFLSRGGTTLGKTGMMVMLGIGVSPCMICAACGYLPLELLLSLLGWLPIVWAVPVIGRELERRTWEALRVTPFSTREIVLAKLAAVVYRLIPLLGFIVARQLALVLSMGLLSLSFMFDPVPSRDSLVVPTLLLGMGAVAIVWTATSVLDFLTNIALGAFASVLMANRNMAYLVAVGVRLGLSGVYIALTALLLDGLANLLAGQTLAPWSLFALLMGGGLLLTLAHALVLAAMLRLTFWRVERFQQ